ncbi:MAG: molybdopterin-dependent oxidoreductase [Chloroflexi bacterium]|nr:molybdopterin-dependent oxidoreductase [Chloroflexota bacterium]
MSARATNLAIFALLLLEFASGVGSYLTGSPQGAWVLWVHGIGGMTLLVLLVWKWRIVMRSFMRQGAGLWAVPSALLGVLFLATLAVGLLWVLGWAPEASIPGYGAMRPMVLHAVLAVVLVIPFATHASAHWPRFKPADMASRRAALRTIALGGAGFVLWRGLDAVSTVTAADRRFTGSREEGSFTGNAHPVTQWLGDERQHLNRAGWRLHVGGEVRTPLELGYGDIEALDTAERRATLDCTGGWYTKQDWAGVPLDALLARAGVDEGANSVVVRSATGYSRRFPLGEARGLLLATHVGGEVLSAGHGFPARLVVPGRRGYHWVKWVVAIEVSARPWWWQPPLPLQ